MINHVRSSMYVFKRLTHLSLAAIYWTLANSAESDQMV